jgi:glycosyltransferase involved in cell wall biosynthesis
LAENLPAKYVHVCPPSFDPKVLNAKEIDAKAVDTLWSEWDVPAATTVILTTEPLEEGHGYRRFIEALGSMKKLPFKAIICADYGEKQPLFTELWRRIDELGLSNSILFIDKPKTASAMKNILAASDVVVFPNRNPLAESQSVVHAQAMGKAVIVCTPGNRAEIVVSGETGWLMSLHNDDTAHQKLALAMTDAITDMTRLQKMGTSATRHCKEHYQTSQTLTDLFAFYESLRNACK